MEWVCELVLVVRLRQVGDCETFAMGAASRTAGLNDDAWEQLVRMFERPKRLPVTFAG
jgi:hypothetical protein